MANLKVIYQSTIRRFSIPSNTTWTQLEAKLRELFTLSPTIPISLSYTDEDGDVITLSTDLELQEILSQQQPSGSTSFKFGLNTLEDTTTTSTSTSNNDSWVLEGRQQSKEEREGSVETIQSETSGLREGVSGLQIDETTLANTAAVVEEAQEMQVEEAIVSQPEPESRPPSYHHITVTDEADEPTYMSVNSKGKEKEISGETSSAAVSKTASINEQEQQQNESDQNQAPSIELAEQFQTLLGQFQDVLAEHPEIFEIVNDVMDQILRAVPVDIEIWAEWLSSLRPGGRQQQQQQTNERTTEGQPDGGQQQGPQFPFLSPDFWTNITPWWGNSYYRGGWPWANGAANNFHGSRGAYGPGAANNCHGSRGAYGPGAASNCHGSRGAYGPGAASNCHGSRGAYGPGAWYRYGSRGAFTGGVGGCRRGRGFNGCHGTRAKKHERTCEQQQQPGEKLRLLHEMGFWEDDVENEELLTRYNGNVDRVIEVLLQRQALKNQQATSDTTDQPMEEAEEQKEL